MGNAGVNIFPEDDSPKYVSIQSKVGMLFQKLNWNGGGMFVW
jgi:hypothetical protein